MLGGRTNTNLFSSPPQSDSLFHTTISVEYDATGGIDEGKKRERERESRVALSLSRSAANGSWFTLIVIYTYISIIYSSQNNPDMVYLATRKEGVRDRVKE
jgi:hypothetical protein